MTDKNFAIGISGRPPIKLKYEILIGSSPNLTDSVNFELDSKFQIDISILATMSEYLATLQ